MVLSISPHARKLFAVYRAGTTPKTSILPPRSPHHCCCSITSHAMEEEEESVAPGTGHPFFLPSSPGTKTIRMSNTAAAAGLSSSVSLYESNKYLKQLVKTNRLVDARHLFDGMSVRDEISWTNIISGYVNASDPTEALTLFSCMRADATIVTDPFLLSLALKACGCSFNSGLRSRGESMHSYAVKSGLAASVFVGSALLDMYAKTGFLASSLQVFDEMPQRNVVSWTAVITALVHNGHRDEAVRCFGDMWASRVACDSYTFAIVLKACADSSLLARGREIHAQAVKLGLDATSFVANSLSTMYSRCGKLDRGLILFSRMRARDVVSWTTVISTYVQLGRHEDAIRAFFEMTMRDADVIPNEYTYAAVLSACAGLVRVAWGEQLHARVTRAGLARSASVSNAVVTMYSSAGRLDSAVTVFRELGVRDVISWSAIISGYAQEGHVEPALALFAEMRRAGPAPNEFTLASLLSACAYAATLEQGRQLHAHALAAGLDGDVMVRSALIVMYSKCGSIGEAGRVFCGMVEGEGDVVSWTAMINGYAEHGCVGDALDLFDRMRTVGLRPDRVTFIGVLGACSHAGLVDLGLSFFRSMREVYGIEPTKEHYGCMVDLLGRAGRVEEAERLAESMPYRPDDVVWSTLLRACMVHGDTDCGRRTAERILKLHPDCAGTHITLSNIYAAKGRWREAGDIRKLMRSKGVRKEPGWSWIMVGDSVSVFVAGDRMHPEGDLIYAMLELLTSMAEMAGYVPEITLLEV